MPKVIIRQTTPPDTTLQVNGVTEGTHVAGSTIGINLSDGVNPVNPDSVTKVGDNYAVVLPACPPAVTRSTATLMKTGQTTSYRTGDDGNIQAGRATDFFTLDAAPVHNDGSATLNTTTNRFTDINGLQVYGDNIVLDWSTWNGSTLLGWYRVPILTNTSGWNQAIDDPLTAAYGGFNVWRLGNIMEIQSINKWTTDLIGAANYGYNYAPFNLAADYFYWSSTTYHINNTQAYALRPLVKVTNVATKTTTLTYYYLPVRTFSLSTSNILS